VYCNRREWFSGDRERGYHPVRESSRLLVHLAKVTSASTVFEITSHRHPIEMSGGVFEPLVCCHVGHLFMGDSNDFAPDVGFFIGCFIGNIWTVSTVILPSFKKKSVNQNLTGMVGVLADDVIERIRGSGFSKAVIPLAFEVLGELEGTNIKGSGGLVRERVIVINRGIRDR